MGRLSGALPTISDYLQAVSGSYLAPQSGKWVRLVNNSTSTAYVSTGATDATGLFTVNNVPAGLYTVSQGPTATGAWTATGDTAYEVAPTNLGWFNILDYGADPTGAVDSSTAIAATHTALPARGGTITIPAGIYKCSSQLAFSKSVVLRGDGSGFSSSLASSVLSFDTGVAGIAIQNGSQFSKIQDLYLKSASSSLGTTDGISVLGHACTIDNVIVDGFARDGVSLDTSGAGNANNSSLRNVRAVNNHRHGFYVAGSNSNVVAFYTCDASANTTDGYHLDGVANCALHAPHADSNGSHGYYDNGNSNSYWDVYAESANAFLIDTSSSAGHLFTGNYAPPALTNNGTNWTIQYGAQWQSMQMAQDLRRSGQAIAYAASITPNATNGEIVTVGTLTGNITVNQPTGAFVGQKLTFIFTQDGTGGRTVTFNAVFRVNWTPSTTLNKRNTITFVCGLTTWDQVSSAVGL